MPCGCKATIGEKDPRAEIWQYVFGSLSFPLLGPFSYNMGDVVGLGYKGDAKSLTPEQRERLIEKMTEKFSITRVDVEESLKDGIVPIKAEGVTLSICRIHVMMAALDGDEDEDSWDEENERDDMDEDDDGGFF